MNQQETMLCAPDRGAIERLQNMDAPEPGTYWAAAKAIQPQYTDRIQVHSLDEGDVLLLTDVVVVDGAPHTYILAPHPEHGKNAAEQKLHADDFHDLFVRSADGPAVRNREIEALQEKIRKTQQSILAPPPPDPIEGAALLTHEPQGASGSALVTPGQVKAMAEYAAALKHRAETQAAWVESKTKELQAQTGLLARYYSEAAQVQLARAKAQLAGVAGILKTVANLQLYTGEGVEVLPLRDGDAADPSEPLTIYQEILAFDEETAILLENDGLDHTNVKELTLAMQDIALVERMIPASRGVAMVRFRNSYKEFVKSDDIGSRLYNAMMNDASKSNRLLVRDGGRVVLISAEGAFKDLKQLLTSVGEQAEHFTGDEEAIRHESLRFAKARASQLNSLDQNAKALIVLWGARDRGEVFANWGAPMGASWLDPAFQNHWMRLLSVDSLLGVERPGFSAFQSEHNKSIAPGSWVAIRSGAAEGLPSKFEYESRITIAQVAREGRALTVRVPIVRKYGRPSGRERQAVKMALTPNTLESSALCLDRVSIKDLDYYLGSRKQRRAYWAFIELFRAARDWVSKRDAEEAGVRSEIREAAKAGGITAEAEAFERALSEAIAAARISMRGARIPDRSAPAFNSFLRVALDILYVKLKGASNVIEAARAHFGAPLIKVAMDRDGYTAYTKLEEAEIDARLRPEGLYGAIRFTLGDEGIDRVPEHALSTLSPVRGEETLWETDERLPRWRWGYQPEQALARFDEVHDASAEAAGMLTKEHGSNLVASQMRQWRASRSRYIQRMVVGIPVGTVKWASDFNRSAGILFVVADALFLAAHLGAEEEAVAAIRRWYGNPEAALERLIASKNATPWGLNVVCPDQLKASLKPHQEWESFRYSGWHIALDDFKKGGVILTTATELAVTLVPDVLPFVKAPTRSGSKQPMRSR